MALSHKQDAGWIRTAFVLMLLVGGANALLGGLGLARVFPLFSDEFLGQDESVRNLALGAVMLVLAGVMLWRRALAAPLFAALMVCGAFVVSLLPDPNDASTLVIPAAQPSPAQSLENVVPVIQGGFALLFALVMLRAMWALRREALNCARKES